MYSRDTQNNVEARSWVGETAPGSAHSAGATLVRSSLPCAVRHFLKYNVVGALGNTLKLAVLALLHELGGLPYLAATALAVEAAMLHNFAWHLRWTWRERCAGNTLRESMARLVWFQLSNGSVALVMNLLIMRVLVGEVRMHYLPANLVATAAAGIINFVIAETLIFRDASARTPRHGIRLAWLRS